MYNRPYHAIVPLCILFSHLAEVEYFKSLFDDVDADADADEAYIGK